MKKLSIFLLSLILCVGFSANAQLDSRNRTFETVITDGLAQLPANTPAKYNEVIGEMAATGQKGIEMLADMLKPADSNKNATFEYAIDAITSYATKSGNEALVPGIHDGLVAGLKKCTDDPNRAFLLTQLNKIAQPQDFDLYKSYLADPYLKHVAVIGLSRIPGINGQMAELINSTETPDADLAYAAYFRRLPGVENTLLKWAKSNDEAVLAAVYNALAVCGTEASVKALESAAKSHKFDNDPTGATDAYLRLLSRLDDKKAAIAAAKNLTKSNNTFIRCAGLNILLNADPANAQKNILAALKDKNIQYRNTALLNAQPTAGDEIYEAVVANAKSYSGDANIDIVKWLGNNHVDSQIDFVIGAINSPNEALSLAAIAAASKIGGDKALQALIANIGTDSAKSQAAQQALLSFNGDIKAGVLAALESSDPNVVAQALKLASARHIYDAFPQTFALVASEDATVSAAAIESLAGVSRPENFEDLCILLEQAPCPCKIKAAQNATKSAISSLDKESQYTAVSARLAKADKENAPKYYPLLAQAGNQQAIELLLSEYANGDKQAAYEALLQVNNPAMIDVLYEIAAQNPDKKDEALGRYIQLVQAAGLNPVENYLLYFQALRLQPSADVQNRLVGALGASNTIHALMLAASYLDNDASAFAAAGTVRYLVSKNEAFRHGEAVKTILEKARNIFNAHKAKGDADAGYAADELNGILNAYDINGGYLPFLEDGDYENVDLWFNWDGTEPIEIALRSEPTFTVDPVQGLVYGDKKFAPRRGINNIHVRQVNDRLFIDFNGVPVVVNEMISGVADKGHISITDMANLSGKTSVFNLYVNRLPDTPIFTLSPEEEAEGFEVLFDGRNLDKWHGNTTAYVPVDGNIYVTAEYGGTGNLYTKENYSDFIYRFEFWFDVPAVNNGIGIRTGKDVTGVDAAFHGMEIQVLDHDDPVYQGYPYGWKGIQPYQIHGSIYGVVGAKHLDFGPIKQWHTEEIKAVGDHITVTVDGQVIVDADIREACQGHAVDPDGGSVNPYMIDHRNHPGLFNKEGYISFCGHGSGVKFRNIRILDLSKNNKSKKSKKK